MTNRKPSDDLTTEQILESIGRIVSEGESRGRSTDVPPLAPPRRKRAGSQDVLDLVDVVDEQGNVIPPGKAAEGRPAFSFPPRSEPPLSRVNSTSSAESSAATVMPRMSAAMPSTSRRSLVASCSAAHRSMRATFWARSIQRPSQIRL